MTDQQVLEYVKKGMASGKKQNDIVKELALKGVDRAQAARVKKLYEAQMAEGEKNKEKTKETTLNDRQHVLNEDYKLEEELDENLTKNKKEEDLNKDLLLKGDTIEVFGRNVFRNNRLSFTPNINMPTPRNYVLGPGDEVIVDIFGANQTTIRSIISPEGYINVDILGPIYLSGKTIDSANSFLKNKLSQIYEGLNGGEEQTDIQISLGQVRSIQVSIIGEVPNPGTYQVSSLATVFHAMFQAGGVKEPGTVRDIKVVRNNKTVASVDIYDFLINGIRRNDVRLEEGDVIVVAPYKNIVKVVGAVKRPLNFEMKDGETVADVLRFAGGFDKSAYSENLSVVRQNAHDIVVSLVESDQFDSFALKNGDEVEVKNMDARYENRIVASGSLKLPGVFELNDEVNSVRKLVKKAGGVLPEAFTQRAIIHRKHQDRSLETMPVNLEGVLNGSKPDVPLMNNDSLYIYSVYDINDQGVLTINGEVADPGIFPFAANTTVQDLILQAGGLLRSASVARVDVARLIVDNESLVAQKDISTYYTFSLNNGFAVDGADKFVLEPYDVVTVRRSPSYVSNRVVKVTGEVNFPGDYNMSRREERVSDIIAKAGNITDFAYIKGAQLLRKKTDAEKKQTEMMTDAIEADNDSILDKNEEEQRYLVSFDMADALKNPGGENDLVLVDGDELIVPVLNNTVKIDGAVQMPTTVSYKKGMKKSDLVNAAGGYAKRAYKRRAYIVYMNGRVSKLRRFTTVEPGSQVFIPKKDKKEGQLQQIMSISTSAASLGMMGVSIANLLK
ncbi:MAG: SLBB domain-containing protein [Bacteroidales bacterium]|nr:SLBB domain-containing protein [Bacteroidales bacterium]